jgi:hypothetical protein
MNVKIGHYYETQWMQSRIIARLIGHDNGNLLLERADTPVFFDMAKGNKWKVDLQEFRGRPLNEKEVKELQEKNES